MVSHLESGKSRDIAAFEAVMIFQDGRIGKVRRLEYICCAQTIQSRSIYGRRSPPQILLVVYVVVTESIGQAKKVCKVNLDIQTRQAAHSMSLIVLSITVEDQMRIAGLAAPADVFVPASVRVLRLRCRVALGQHSDRSGIAHSLLLRALVAMTLGSCERDHLADADFQPRCYLMIHIHPAGVSLKIRTHHNTVSLVISQTGIDLSLLVSCCKTQLVVGKDCVSEDLVSPVSAGLSARVCSHRRNLITRISIRIRRVQSISIITCIFQILKKLRTVEHAQGPWIGLAADSDLTAV